jgi:hypothetical protein
MHGGRSLAPFLGRPALAGYRGMGLAQPTNLAMPDRERPRQQRSVSSLIGNANKDGERQPPLAEHQQKRKKPDRDGRVP